MKANDGRTYTCELCGESIDDEDDPLEVTLTIEGEKVHVECAEQDEYEYLLKKYPIVNTEK